MALLFLHILVNIIRNLNIFCMNFDIHEMLLLQRKKGQGINTVVVILLCNSLMSVTLLFFLSILLNNLRNLEIFCMNVDIYKLLLGWNFLLTWAMLRMSYCDHFSSAFRPDVRPSVNIFKRLLLWSLWANFAQISYGASLGWVKEKLLKWSWCIDQDDRHAHIW